MPDFEDRVVDRYLELGSVRRVGNEFRIGFDLVTEIIHKKGGRLRFERFTNEEKKQIVDYYNLTPKCEFDLSALATAMGREKTTICKFAQSAGLTIQGRPHTLSAHKKQGNKLSALWRQRGHPRGMLGKKHTPETLKTVSAASKKTWATWKTFGIGHMAPEAKERNRQNLLLARAFVTKPYTRARGGRREDIGPTWFRSSWEANYARYLNLLIRLGVVETWEYEPETFWFEGIKRGVCSYRPDFRVKYKGDFIPEYVELKGWVVAKDRTKWRRMAKYHPSIKLVIIKEKEYNALSKKWASSIPNWEGPRGGGRKLGPRIKTAGSVNYGDR